MSPAPPFDDPARLDRLAAALDLPGVVAVYGTGSRVRGGHRPDSDVDLYYWHDPFLGPDAIELLRDVVRAVAGRHLMDHFGPLVGIPGELMFGDRDAPPLVHLDARPLNHRHFSATLAPNTIRDGLLILDRDPQRRALLEAEAVKALDGVEVDARGLATPWHELRPIH